MFKKKKLAVFLVVCFFLVPCLCLLGFVVYQGESLDNHKNPSDLFVELKDLYVQKKYEEARLKMEPALSQIISLEEGCDLVVSVYAELKAYIPLESCSQKCFSKKNHSGAAYEGYALASFQLNKGDTGIKILEEELNKGYNDRLLVALAQFSFLLKDDLRAKNYFLEVIKKSDIWSAWILRVLQYQRLFSDKVFVEKLSLLVSSKDRAPKKAVDLLLAHAKLHKLETCVEALTKCMKTKVS